MLFQKVGMDFGLSVICCRPWLPRFTLIQNKYFKAVANKLEIYIILEPFVPLYLYWKATT